MQYEILSKQKRMRVVNLWEEEDGACWMVIWDLATTLPVWRSRYVRKEELCDPGIADFRLEGTRNGNLPTVGL